MTVRLAKPEDLPALVELGREFHVESRLAGFAYAPERIWKRLEKMLANRDRCCLVAADRDGELVGFLLGALEEYWVVKASVARLQFWYLKPRFRGTLRAMQLFHGFRRWATRREAMEIAVGLSAGIESEKLGRIFERMGFHRSGGNYSSWLQ